MAATSLLNQTDWAAALQRLVPLLRAILLLDLRIRLAAAGSFFDRVFNVDGLDEDLLDDLVDRLMENEIARRLTVAKPSSDIIRLEDFAVDLAALAVLIPEIDTTTDSVSALTTVLSKLDEPIARINLWTGMAEKMGKLPAERCTVRRQRWAHERRGG